jgi:hypothetical protein
MIGPITTRYSTDVPQRNVDVRERSSDVLVWRDGGWKAVFTQETEIFKP